MDERLTMRIEDMTQVIAFRKDIRDTLSRYAFSAHEREEILLAFTELGTNLYIHAPHGLIEIAFPTEEAPSVRIRSSNVLSEGAIGPGTDGGHPGSSRGLGIGLSSLHRLMDRAEVKVADGAFVVTCEKWLHKSSGG